MKYLSLIKIGSTLALMILAVALGRQLWLRSMYAPWTRDGRVQADVIHLAADVGGLIRHVAVQDNQWVQRGDLLLSIDPQRYILAVRQAQAQVLARQADLRQRQQNAQRREQLAGSVVSAESASDARTGVDDAQAQLNAARASLALAQLNLQRTAIRAPVDGYISNLKVHPGDYAQVGQPLLALVDSHSFWVYGYFEETKINHIHVGDPVSVLLMSGGPALPAHVDSLARGITDRDNTQGRELLADVNPTFSWVRLAQRIPVRIRFDRLPAHRLLAAGMTCTVIIHPRTP